MYAPLLQLFTCSTSSTACALRNGSVFLVLVFGFFPTSPMARAVTPPPDGGYFNYNTAEGTDALLHLTTGFGNTALGASALRRNEDGNENTASGISALYSNKTGDSNTATGGAALHENVSGNANTATGQEALFFNVSGGGNTADGFQALLYNKTGSFNTSAGYEALHKNITGFFNTAYGFRALYNTTGLSNIGLGSYAGYYLTTGNNNIDIGNSGVAGDDKKIRIGTKGTHDGTFIAGISGVSVSGSQVVVNSNGRLGVAASSARYKEAIKPMDKTSEAILALEPVTFRYKQEIDPEDIPQFGLIAEQVEKVNPDLVARDEDGKVTTVRYEAVNAMLLNEFLKEHGKVEQLGCKAEAQEAAINALKTTIAEQQKNFQATTAQQEQEIKALTASLREQASAVRKVSDELKLSKPLAHMAAKDQ